MLELIGLTDEDLATVLLVHESYSRVHATAYAIIASRRRAGMTTPSIADLCARTGFPDAMVYKAVVELVHERLLHWTVISPTRSESRVTVA